MDILTAVVAGIAGVVGFVVGLAVASSSARQAGTREAETRAGDRLRSLVDALRRGRLPEEAEPGSPEADLASALKAGWTPREEERRQALHEAIGRVGAFLDAHVRRPLRDAGPGADAEELRERIDRALGSLEDLDFFLEQPGTDTRSQNVSDLVQQVTREFAQDQDVLVRLQMSGPVRAEIDARSFMDAFYLLLHNAGRFGGGGAVDVTVVEEAGQAVVRVRDRGPGFTEEAFERAFDPFYSTTPDGLGLGLPHARRTLEAMGGRVELRNAPDGGAEVEVAFGDHGS